MRPPKGTQVPDCGFSYKCRPGSRVKRRLWSHALKKALFIGLQTSRSKGLRALELRSTIRTERFNGLNNCMESFQTSLLRLTTR